MLWRPGAASRVQGVLQTASGRPSSVALAPAGLVMMVTGSTVSAGAAAVEARCGVSRTAGASGLGLSCCAGCAEAACCGGVPVGWDSGGVAGSADLGGAIGAADCCGVSAGVPADAGGEDSCGFEAADCSGCSGCCCCDCWLEPIQGMAWKPIKASKPPATSTARMNVR